MEREMYNLIKGNLERTDKLPPVGRDKYVAVMTTESWNREKESFGMGIDIEGDKGEILTTKAEVNYDSLTGTFCIPNRSVPGEQSVFSFALDENGIVFIDDGNTAAEIIEEIRRTKKWKFPSLERFLFDFLEQIVKADKDVLEKYDRELDHMESAIVDDAESEATERLNGIRNDIRELRVHYEQLLDFSQELEENENSFFTEENLRYFRLFTSKVERLRDTTMAVGDHALQIRDIYKSHLDIRQNHIMTVLTVVTSIFMPLTLITGWYGMNFNYMPELASRWAYPTVFGLCVLIVIISLIFFKKKKWL